jgi:hypothetical protein
MIHQPAVDQAPAQFLFNFFTVSYQGPCGSNCFCTVCARACVRACVAQFFITLPNDTGLMNEVKSRSQHSHGIFPSLEPVGHKLP